MFQEMMRGVRKEIARMILRVQIVREGEKTPERTPSAAGKLLKVSRNDPCPCGSGKKYKRCCLK
jgi:uncharacterized protein YecA (UPF0149 family)